MRKVSLREVKQFAHIHILAGAGAGIHTKASVLLITVYAAFLSDPKQSERI
jgi:hypothetical protein